MNWTKFYLNFKNTKWKFAVQNATICILAVGLTISAYMANSLARAKRTIILPSSLNARIEIADSEANPEYLKVMVSYALNLLYSFTPDNVYRRYQEFLVSFTLPSDARVLRPMLEERLKKIQQIKVAEQIDIDEFIFYDRKTILIRGKTHHFSLGQPYSVQPLYMMLNYKIIEGLLKVTGMEALNAQEYQKFVRREQVDAKKAEKDIAKREKRQNTNEKLDRAKRMKGSASTPEDHNVGAEDLGNDDDSDVYRPFTSDTEQQPADDEAAN